MHNGDIWAKGRVRLPAQLTNNMKNTCPLVVIKEPGRTALHVLIKEPIFIGRGGSGILVDDPQVSRQHLELIPGNNELKIRDCDSTHGTSLDGNQVDAEVVLGAGSIARLGNVTVELIELEERDLDRADLGSEKSDSTMTSIERVAGLVSDTDASSIPQRQSERTLTIVFSDIEGSTELALAVGDTRWYEILSAHNQLLRESIRKFGGSEVKSYGDGFMLTFLSARAAVDALMEIQRRLNATQPGDALQDIRIRAGVHVGEAIVDQGGDLFGRHVNIAARIAAEAAGGEILVSPLVREIIEARGDLGFDDPRSVSLKGIASSYMVHPIVWR